VVAQLQERTLAVTSLDVTLVTQSPRMAPYIEIMRRHLAQDLALDAGRINVKATTTERLGFTGRGEGIACYAVTLLSDDGECPTEAKSSAGIELSPVLFQSIYRYVFASVW